MKLKYSKKRHFSNKTKRNKHKLRKSKKRAINYTNKKNRKRHVKRGGSTRGSVINLKCTKDDSNPKKITCETTKEGAATSKASVNVVAAVNTPEVNEKTGVNAKAAATAAEKIKAAAVKAIDALNDDSSEAEFDAAIVLALDILEFKEKIGGLGDEETKHTILRKRPDGGSPKEILIAKIRELKAEFGTPSK
jgi:hypothetical protein